VAALQAQHIETPSGLWRQRDALQGFAAPGAARNLYEKINDAAFIHRLTGVAPSIALHIPWDKTTTGTGWSAYAASAA